MTSVPSTVGIVASGEDVLNDAVFWVDAGRSSISNGALTYLGTGGSALNAVFGNSTGVDSFDPALLTHTGTNYLYLPGLASNYASTPSATPLNVNGDIELVLRCRATDWSSGAFQTLINKRVGAPNQSFGLRLNGSAGLDFVLSADGTTVATASSTVVFPGLDNVTYWIKTTYRTSDLRVQFWYASDQTSEPTVWSQIGADVTHTVGSIATSSAILEIGSRLNGAVDTFTGLIFRVIIRNGIGGTTVFDADFTTGITSGAQTTFTESSANAATVTINRATSGRKSVAVVRPILLFGTDDYLEVADNDLLDFGASDSFTAVAVVRQWATPNSFGRVMSKAPTSGAQWQLLNNSTNAQRYLAISDGTTTVNAGVGNPYTIGALAITSAVRSTATAKITLYNGNSAQAAVTDTTTGSLANSNVLRIGQASTGGATSDMELVAAAVWRRALNANEIATIVNRYT